MRSFGTIRKYDTRFVPEYSSFHGARNPPGEGSEHRSSQASRLCTQQAGVANLKVAGHQRLLANALERLLGKGRPQIIQVAKETLEGNLRGVLSQLPPEEVNQDKLRFAEKLLEEAEHGLSRLGLVLDVLKIQNVADEVGYLDSLGRKQTASLDRSARVAEAELKVQKARLEQVRLKLEADVVAPARADMEKRQAEARGRAAKIVEDGRATAAVLTQMIQAWKAAGPNARDIFLMQKLQTVMSSLVETIREVKVDRVAYLPASAKVAQGVQLVEQVKAAFGVDLAKVVERLGAPGETLASAKLMAGETLGAASQTAPAKPKA